MIKIRNSTKHTLTISVSFGNPKDPDSGTLTLKPFETSDEMPPDPFLEITDIK